MQDKRDKYNYSIPRYRYVVLRRAYNMASLSLSLGGIQI